MMHDLVQGSDAWHEFRLTHFGASEAAAMLGLSTKVKRSELLRMKHTGRAREFSDWLQKNVLDKGHEVEALARPHVEANIGEELYPVTYSDGLLSASCDGLTLDEETAFEHKQINAELAEIVGRGEVPAEHMPQCQQVLMVTGAKRLIFVVSDGTEASMRCVWVKPDTAWFERLRDGWAQFSSDLAAFSLPDSAEPAPVGKAPETLPALRIEVTGMVTASNLAEFKETALAAIRSVNRSLSTDADFADAEKAVKWCGDVESRLAAAKEHALSQTASIDELFKAIDDISAEARRVRLDLDKLVTRRKSEVKDEAISRARRALDAHIATLNAEIAPMRLQPVAADFAGAIKGKRSIDSMQDALDTTLAAAKIAADGAARLVRTNLFAFKAKAAGFELLFFDLHDLVHKPESDFCALVDGRIATHKAAEAEKERQRAAAEAERIAAAEQRAREQEAARIAAQQAEDARVAALAKQREQDAAAESIRVAAAAAATVNVAGPAHLAPQPAPGLQFDSRGVLVTVTPVLPDKPAADANARAFVDRIAKPDEPATLNLGAICGRLGFTVSAAFLADVLHVQPAKTDKRATLYTERQFALICRQLVSHVSAMAELYAGETA